MPKKLTAEVFKSGTHQVGFPAAVFLRRGKSGQQQGDERRDSLVMALQEHPGAFSDNAGDSERASRADRLAHKEPGPNPRKNA